VFFHRNHFLPAGSLQDDFWKAAGSVRLPSICKYHDLYYNGYNSEILLIRPHAHISGFGQSAALVIQSGRNLINLKI